MIGQSARRHRKASLAVNGAKVTNGLFEADAGVLHASDVKPASLCVRVLDDDPTATDTGPATAPARRTETVLNASGLPVVVRCGITGT
jgi:hypothetical protein